jgi:hypothetical protein
MSTNPETLPPRLTRKAAAAFLTRNGYRVTAATLAAKRVSGPKFVVFGRDSFYAESDLLAWAQSRVQHRGGQPAQPRQQAA